MKKFFLSAIALFICGSSFAQIIGEKRHYFGFNVGAAVPVGNFSSTYYAKTGLNVNLEGAGYFIPFVGIAASLGGFSNAYDVNKLNTNTSTFTSNSWQNAYAMVGPIVSLPLSKFTIDAKVLFGALGTKTPNTENVYATGKSVKDEKFVANFGYTIGGSVRYNIIKKLAVKLNVDYVSANQTVNGNIKNYTTGKSEPTSYTDYSNTIDVRNVNIGLGLVLQFVD